MWEKLEFGREEKIVAAYVVRFFYIGATIIHVFLVGLLLSRKEWWLSLIVTWPAFMCVASWRHMHRWIADNDNRLEAKRE
jgi:hypothetical protein